MTFRTITSCLTQRHLESQKEMIEKLGYKVFLKIMPEGLPGGPVIKNPPSNAGGHGFNPWSGN